MTAAELYAAKTTGSVFLPVAKITATVRVPRSRELARAGLLPLRLTHLDPQELEEEEMADAIEKAEITFKRLVCECSVYPRIVDREPETKEQMKYSDLADEDITVLYNKIMELAKSAYFDAEPATESKAQLDSMTLIAIHARKWGMSPLEVGKLSPEEFDELMTYSDLLDAAIEKAKEQVDG